MWGNKLGWGLSAGLVVFVIGIIMMIQAASGVAPPTDVGRRAAVQAIQLPVNPATIVPMTAGGDAAELYRQAIALALKDRKVFEESPVDMGRQAKIRPAVDAVLKATPLSSMNLFAADPAKVVKYEYPGHRRDELDALYDVGKTVINFGTIEWKRNNRPDDARKCYEAAFSLGAKLWNERVVYEELRYGYALMQDACEMLRMLAVEKKDAARQEQIKAFADATRQYMDKELTATWNTIHVVDLNLTARHTGDWYLLARKAEERMWRVEAIMQIGMLPYMGARFGDQRAAARVLARLAESPDEDPAVKLAADAARKLTLIEYRQLGN